MPPLPAIANPPGNLRGEALIRQAAMRLDTLQEEMQFYYGQRSDNGKESDRGEALRERLEAVQRAQEAAAELRP
jgi:hypothetical protein